MKQSLVVCLFTVMLLFNHELSKNPGLLIQFFFPCATLYFETIVQIGRVVNRPGGLGVSQRLTLLLLVHNLITCLAVLIWSQGGAGHHLLASAQVTWGHLTTV